MPPGSSWTDYFAPQELDGDIDADLAALDQQERDLQQPSGLETAATAASATSAGASRGELESTAVTPAPTATAVLAGGATSAAVVEGGGVGLGPERVSGPSLQLA